MSKTPVYYFWYDHGIVCDTGEADIVTEAIKHKDFDTFIKIKNKYPETEDVCFFPDFAFQHCASGRTRKINITTRKGFEKITDSEHECG